MMGITMIFAHNRYRNEGKWGSKQQEWIEFAQLAQQRAQKSKFYGVSLDHKS